MEGAPQKLINLDVLKSLLSSGNGIANREKPAKTDSQMFIMQDIGCLNKQNINKLKAGV